MFLNNVSLAGIVATTPVFKPGDGSKTTLTFNLRCDRPGGKKPSSDVFRVVVEGKYAAVMSLAVGLGSVLGVEGRLRQRRHGRRSRIEVLVSTIQFEPSQPNVLEELKRVLWEGYKPPHSVTH